MILLLTDRQARRRIVAALAQDWVGGRPPTNGEKRGYFDATVERCLRQLKRGWRLRFGVALALGGVTAFLLRGL